MTARVALAVSGGKAGAKASNKRIIAALADHGVDAAAVPWDIDRDWGRFDLVVLRQVFDYASRREEFLAWAKSVPRLLNPAGVVAWNSDKHYLKQLAEAGIPVVPTLWLEPEDDLGARGLHTRFPSLGDFVIKPAISAGGADTGRYTAVDGRSRGLAIDHALWLLDSGRSVLMQRYVRSVDVSGERALYFIDGEYSHALQRAPMLLRSGGGATARQRASLTEASPAEREAALAALDAARSIAPKAGKDPFLYARVDLISGDDDEPLVLEIELIKSQIKAGLEPEAVPRLAKAIAGRVAG